jgi:hypothetical protein
MNTNIFNVIMDLHRKGYTEDFKVSEGRIFWLQEKIYLNPGDYTVAESYIIKDSKGKKVNILGLRGSSIFANGILMGQ